MSMAAWGKWGRNPKSTPTGFAGATTKLNPFSAIVSSEQSTNFKPAAVIPPPPDAYFSLNPNISSLPKPGTQQSSKPEEKPAQLVFGKKPEEKPAASEASNEKAPPTKSPAQEVTKEKSNEKKSDENEDRKKGKGKKLEKKPKNARKRKTKKSLLNAPFLNQPILPPFNFSPPPPPLPRPGSTSIAAFEDEIFDDTERIIIEVLGEKVQESELDQFYSLLSTIVKKNLQTCIKEAKLNPPPTQFNQFGPPMSPLGGFGLNSPFMPPNFGMGQQFMNPGMMPFNQQMMPFAPNTFR